MRTNDITKTIVLPTGVTVLTTGAASLSAAANNTIGIYTREGVGVNATAVPTGFKDLIIAYKDANGKVVTSAGQAIQKGNIQKVSAQPAVAGVQQQTKIAGFTTVCGGSFGITIETKNPEIYRTQGYVQFKKTFVAKLPDCDGTTTYGDANVLAKDLIIQINNNADGLYSAKATARGAIPTGVITGGLGDGADVSDANLAILIAYNAVATNTTKYYVDIVVTSLDLPATDFADIPLTYYYPRQNICVVSKVGGLNSTGTITQTVAPVMQIGSGLDVKYLEYKSASLANGYNKVSAINGVALPQGLKANSAITYKQYAITADYVTVDSGIRYENTLTTIVAVPTGDAAITNLDIIFGSTSFGALTQG